jgi:hypothetical protein
MEAFCPLHGRTTIVGTNAFGFPVYACCCNDVNDASPPDACTRAPQSQGQEHKQESPERKTRRE